MDKLKKILSQGCTENKDFRCSLCNKFLSVAPIFYSNSIGNICGRCGIENLPTDKKENEIIERQTVFENVGKFMKFPCSNHMKGCKEELNWEEVTTHESSCPFKNNICPLSIKEFLEDDQEECTWKGEDENLFLHIKEEHKKYFSDPPQVCLAPEFKSRIIFNETCDGQLVAIILDYQKSSYKYYFHIFANLPSFQCDQYTCDLEMTDESKTSSVIIQRDGIEPIAGGFLREGNGNCLEIDIYSIKELLKKPAVTVIFNIKKKCSDIYSAQVSPISTGQITSLNDKSELMIEELEDELKEKLICDFCRKFSIPPIFSCNTNHYICAVCYKSMVNQCPVCYQRGLVDNSYTLELITKGLNYPCENKDNGCLFKAPLLKLQLHEDVCSLAPRTCLLDCTWQCNGNTLLSHIQEVHGFSEMDRVYSLELNSMKKSMVNFEEELFYFTLSYKFNEPFQCNVYCIGKEMIEYKYDLVLIGSTSMGVKMMLSHLCQPAKSNKIPERFTGISIPFACLKQFISNTNNLRFKINISKIKNSNKLY